MIRLSFGPRKKKKIQIRPCKIFVF